MAVSAGKLRDRIMVQARTQAPDAIGQMIDTWADFAPLWAWVKFQNGTEFNRADVPQASTNASIRIRYNASITTEMRILFGTKIFNIKAILPSEDKSSMDLAVDTGLNNG
jgi:SPP1 family predicted phage head-tail adaptor